MENKAVYISEALHRQAKLYATQHRKSLREVVEAFIVDGLQQRRIIAQKKEARLMAEGYRALAEENAREAEGYLALQAEAAEGAYPPQAMMDIDRCLKISLALD